MLEQLALQATAVEAQEARSLANIPVDSTKLAGHWPSTRVQHKTHANSSRSPAMRPRALPILMLLPWANLGPATSNLLHGPVNRIPLAVGQSYKVGGKNLTPRAGERHPRVWDQRTYLLWEPRFGSFAGKDALGFFAGLPDTSGFGMWGVGVSLGVRWDRGESLNGAPDVGFLGGVWGGGGYLFPRRGGAECGNDRRAYISAALGLRGGEIYFTPKLGVMEVPEFCLLW